MVLFAMRIDDLVLATSGYAPNPSRLTAIFLFSYIQIYNQMYFRLQRYIKIWKYKNILGKIWWFREKFVILQQKRACIRPFLSQFARK